MAKRAVTLWWIAGSVVMFAGFFATVLVSIATHPGNPLNGQTGTSTAFLVAALMVAFVGVALQLVAWVGSLFNSHLLTDRTWFNLLLWLGIAGVVTSPAVIGGIVWWALMLAYVAGAPEGEPAATTPTRLAPTS